MTQEEMYEIMQKHLSQPAPWRDKLSGSWDGFRKANKYTGPVKNDIFLRPPVEHDNKFVFKAKKPAKIDRGKKNNMEHLIKGRMGQLKHSRSAYTITTLDSGEVEMVDHTGGLIHSFDLARHQSSSVSTPFPPRWDTTWHHGEAELRANTTFEIETEDVITLSGERHTIMKGLKRSDSYFDDFAKSRLAQGGIMHIDENLDW